MRNDPLTMHDRNRPDDSAGDDGSTAPVPAGSRALGIDWVKVPALLALVAATCWVAAAWASVWLVPPYLVVMTLLLCPNPTRALRRPRRVGESNLSAAPTASSPDRVAPSGEEAADGGPAGTEPRESSVTTGGPAGPLDSRATDPSPEPGSGSGSATATARPKRARSRTRKSTSKPVAEPTPSAAATWVEVGPGKFVRVETTPVAESVAGPHHPVGLLPDCSSPAALVAAPEVTEAVTAAESTDFDPVTISGTLPGLDFIFRYHTALSSVPVPAPDLLELAAETPGVAPDPVPDALELCGLRPTSSPQSAACAGELNLPPDLDLSTADGIAPQVEPDKVESAGFDPTAAVAASAGNSDPTAAVFDPSTETAEPAGAADPRPNDASATAPVVPTAGSTGPDEPIAAGREPEEARDDAATDEVQDQDRPATSAAATSDLAAHPGCEAATVAVTAVARTLADVTTRSGRGKWCIRLTRGLYQPRVGNDRRPSRHVPPGRGAHRRQEMRPPTNARCVPGRRVARPRQITRTSPPRSPPRPGLVG